VDNFGHGGPDISVAPACQAVPYLRNKTREISFILAAHGLL
jgi:hypothetical protein